ncbi:MAG: diguanylate cyclase [Moraxellaceae bacterium]|nr:diguanylate cyclase [Moraxellaceae bacterium]
MPRLLPEKFRLLGWISILLLTGFFFTILASYLSSRSYVRHSIAESALPLTSDNIYSEIQKDILRPIFISSLMAQDTFVRDWLLAGEQDSDRIVRYLKEVKTQYGMVSSSLVSEKTLNYYYGEGILKQVNEGEHRDTWYFRVRNMKEPYEINIDIDMANNDAMTIFINYRVLDYAGRFIGSTGVGVTLDTMGDLIDSYEERFRRVIYFTDGEGRIMLSGGAMRASRSRLHDMPGISALTGLILNRNVRPTQLSYEADNGRVLVNSRFIPELGWYLVVEQNEAGELRQAQQVLLINVGVALGITLFVLAVAWIAVRRYQDRLERLASHDSLTGSLNRQAFELVFSSFMREASRSKTPLSAVLFDVDHFKLINDRHGHLAGDDVLRKLAELVRTSLRQSDVVARWGGEEFMILLTDCSEEKAMALAETLRTVIANHEFGDDRVTVSMGVSAYRDGEDETVFFSRLDKAMYAAKAGGRNQVCRGEALTPDLSEQ